MITGDYHHTAIAVAKDVGMIQSDTDIVVIDATVQSTAMSDESARRSSFSASPLSYLTPPADAKGPSESRFAGQRSAIQIQPAEPSLHTSSSQSPRSQSHLEPEQPADAGSHISSSAQSAPAPSHGAAEASPLSHAFQHSHGQLRVVHGMSSEAIDLSHALQSMACGQCQCAVTGAAFQHLLQTSDLSILETVMRNVVVFSRMKPHQKGQVMNLLSVRGLHQMHQGVPRHIQV